MDDGTMPSGKPGREPPAEGPGLWSLASLGLTIGVSMALFVGGGLWLDSATHRSPLFTMIGVVLGITSAVMVAYREIRPFL